MPNVLQKIVSICKIDKIFYSTHSDSIITLPFIITKQPGHLGSKYKNFAILQNLLYYPNGWLLLHQKTAAAKAHPEKESRRRQLCTMASFFQENRSPSPSTPFLLLLPSATATASHPSSHSSEKSQQLEDEDQGNARKGISVKVASTAFYSFFYVALLSKTYKRKCAFCSFAVQLQNMYAMTVDNE